MNSATSATAQPLPRTPWGLLPPQLRVLFITGENRSGRWLAEALAGDSGSSVELEEAIGAAAGLAALRDELYDAVLISHLPGETRRGRLAGSRSNRFQPPTAGRCVGS